MSSYESYAKYYGDESYPPPGVLMFGKLIDTLCSLPSISSTTVQVGEFLLGKSSPSSSLGRDANSQLCSNWRSYMHNSFINDSNNGWFSEKYRIDNYVEKFPQVLTFEDFLQQHQQEEGASSGFSSIYKYAFQTSSTSLSVLTTPTSILTLAIIVLILRLIKYRVLLPYFSSLGRSFGRKTHGPEWEKHNSERIYKFGEYCFRLLYHTAIALYGITYFYNKPWWKFLGSSTTVAADHDVGTKTLFSNYPYHDVMPGMIWYYLIQSAYNIDAMISLLEISFSIKLQSPVTKISSCDRNNNNTSTTSTRLQPPIAIHWSDSVRGDFREMFIHHVATNMLIIGSSYFRFTRIGSMVFVVHDISDIPVDLSKLANFLKWKVTTICCFVTMCVSWLLLRLGVLPFVIYRSVLYESILVTTSGIIKPIAWYCYQPMFAFLLGLLITLHITWFIILMRIGYILVTKSETHDLSEHKNGEKEFNGTSLKSGKNSPLKQNTDSFISNVKSSANGKHHHHKYANGNANNVISKKKD